MTFFRKYRALYDFDARTGAELSMGIGDMLLVERLADGSWPPPQKWMLGTNERTSMKGEFPGDAYVEFIEEFMIEPEPPPLPPEVEQRNHAPPALPPVVSPRHVKVQKGFQLPPVFPTGLVSQLNNTMEERKEEEEEQAPPPPPRQRSSASSGGGGGGGAPPVPAPRKRMSETREIPMPMHAEVADHRWSLVKFGIPVPCVGCDDHIWGSSSAGYKCEECLGTCHESCRDHVETTQECIAMDDRQFRAQLEYTHSIDSWQDWTEMDLLAWMKAVNISAYHRHFKVGGVVKGYDLQGLDNARLLELGVMDDIHRLNIMECLDELMKGSSSVMETLAYEEDTDGGRGGMNRLSALITRSPSLASVQSVLGRLGQKKGDVLVGDHNFQVHSFTAQWCDVCGRFLWGLVRQGMKCSVCGMSVHRMCMTDSIVSCEHWMQRLKTANSAEMVSFGVDLSSLFVEGEAAPEVVLKSIEAVEATGLGIEGIYRISPPLHSLNSLRRAFDSDASSVNPHNPTWDPVVFSAALKLFLRDLPDPVIPYNLYPRFVSASRHPRLDLSYSQLQPLLEQLPPHHRATLETILDHLAKVATHEHYNKMGVQNLALVFGPSLVHPQPDELDVLVENSVAHCRVVEALLSKGPWLTNAQRPPDHQPPPIAAAHPHNAGPPPTVRRELKPSKQPAPLPPRPHSASSSGSSLPPRLGSSGVKAVPNPYSLEQEDTDAIYEAHESDSFGGGTPVTPSFTPSSAIDIGPIEEQGWYWGNITREDVVNKLRDTSDGTYLVRDSRREGEYTLTVRKGGANKLIRIICSNGKYGFSEPTGFGSVPELVEYYRQVPLTKYNARLDVTLVSPISRFAQVEEEEEEDDEDESIQTSSMPAGHNEADKATFYLTKLQELTDIFEAKNEDYQAMEEKSEKLRKAMESSNKIVMAHTQVLEMIKEQLQIFDSKSHSQLSKNEQHHLMENAKLLGQRRINAEKNMQQAIRHNRETTVEYRTMDKDINTVRPQLMKLQRNKDEYTRKLVDIGWTKEYINQMVKEKAVSETESIYGTLYGTLGEDSNQENIDNDDDPQEEDSGPVIPEKPRLRPPMKQPLPLPPRIAPPTTAPPQIPPSIPPIDSGRRKQPPRPPAYEGMDLKSFNKERQKSLPPLPQPLPSNDNKPHKNMDTWFCEVDRLKSGEMLRGKQNGTFLCRPTSKQSKLRNGELHTHTVDVVYNGQKHLKVVQVKDRFGFSAPCTYPSLTDLVLFYSENSLEQHNPGLTTTLQHPINA